MFASKRWAFAVGVALAALWCASCRSPANVLPPPAKLQGPGAELAALRQGRDTFLMECAACHRLHWPAEYEPDKWRSILRDHGSRSGLGSRELAAVELYLTRSSRALAGQTGAAP